MTGLQIKRNVWRKFAFWCTFFTALLFLGSCAVMHSSLRGVASDSNILFSANHETGDLSQWAQSQGDAVFNSGTGEVSITQDVAFSGEYAVALRIQEATGQEQAARLFRWRGNPREAYYSAWFYFPEHYEPAEWWNVFQFKSPHPNGTNWPIWVLNVRNTDDGEMMFYLWHELTWHSYGLEHQLTSKITTIPVGQWVHVEAFYRRSTDESGSITVWQDGVKLYDVDNVQTALTDTIHWSLNNYTNEITPSDVTIYIDDAIISKTRANPTQPNSDLGQTKYSIMKPGTRLALTSTLLARGE